MGEQMRGQRVGVVFGGRQRVLTMVMISLGAMVGANLRYALSLWATLRWGASFPYGTVLINVLGSFLIGLIMVAATTRGALSVPWRLLLVTGLLGGFTTFSTFSFETYTLIVAGCWLKAVVNVVVSVGVGLVGVFLGAGLAHVLP